MKLSIHDVPMPEHPRTFLCILGNAHLPVLAQRGYKWHSSLNGYDIFFRNPKYNWVIVSKKGGDCRSIWESEYYPNDGDTFFWKKIHN